jgi:hypothetical protein
MLLALALLPQEPIKELNHAAPCGNPTAGHIIDELAGA